GAEVVIERADDQDRRLLDRQVPPGARKDLGDLAEDREAVPAGIELEGLGPERPVSLVDLVRADVDNPPGIPAVLGGDGREEAEDQERIHAPDRNTTREKVMSGRLKDWTVALALSFGVAGCGGSHGDNVVSQAAHVGLNTMQAASIGHLQAGEARS